VTPNEPNALTGYVSGARQIIAETRVDPLRERLVGSDTLTPTVDEYQRLLGFPTTVVKHALVPSGDVRTGRLTPDVVVVDAAGGPMSGSSKPVVPAGAQRAPSTRRSVQVLRSAASISRSADRRGRNRPNLVSVYNTRRLVTAVGAPTVFSGRRRLLWTLRNIKALLRCEPGAVRCESGEASRRLCAMTLALSHPALIGEVSFVPTEIVGMFLDGISLRPGSAEADDTDLWTALEIAQAADFVLAAGGFEAEITQGGTNVSGGQRQRFSIARALVRRPDVWLIDDSFSALDLGTDARLRAALRSHTADATVLVMAQRISTIVGADQILVLDGGRQVGLGIHAELQQTCPTYAEIVSSQIAQPDVA
jgi:ABC-type cobalamin/Fe3+-siderophores transport system ATPase subunit